MALPVVACSIRWISARAMGINQRLTRMLPNRNGELGHINSFPEHPSVGIHSNLSLIKSNFGSWKLRINTPHEGGKSEINPGSCGWEKQKILSTSTTTVLDQRPVMHIHRIHPIKLYCILLVWWWQRLTWCCGTSIANTRPAVLHSRMTLVGSSFLVHLSQEKWSLLSEVPISVS